MRSTLLSSVVLVGIGAVIGISSFGCTETECGPGTINRAGQCEPADETVGVAKCGPSTELRGDQCVPKLPPTKCDPATTQPDTDADGITTCIGTGGGGCSAPLACPDPGAGKQTVCGQIYNFADNKPFSAMDATGAMCTAGATAGPCALKMNVYYPVTATILTPLATHFDDCGRFRVELDVNGIVPGFTFQFDDSDSAKAAGRDATVPTMVGVTSAAATSTKNVEAFVLDTATLNKWTGAPSLATGIYTAIFRAHACDAAGKCNGDRFANKDGVIPTRAALGTIGPVSYFAAEASHLRLDPTATKTTLNGAALTSVTTPGNGTPTGTVVRITGNPESLTDQTNCVWFTSSALRYNDYVYFQVFRPINNGSQTCTL